MGRLKTGAGRSVAWKSFNMPSSLTGGGKTLTWSYDAELSRVKEVSPDTATTTYYPGAERLTATDNTKRWRHFISTPEGVVGHVDQLPNGTLERRYFLRDHLGSVVALINESGAKVENSISVYDAWGKRASPVIASPDRSQAGFTGHEMLDEVGLVHMNGRIYDPALGKFLSADPIVQAPMNGQSWNRYSYVMNAPLSATDPTGYSSWWVQWRRPIGAIAAAVAAPYALNAILGSTALAAGASNAGLIYIGELGTVLSGTGNAVAALAGGFAAGGIAGGNVQSAIQGAIFASLSFGIGEAYASGMSFGGKVAAHGVVGCARQAAAGGDCGAGALSAGFSAAAGAVDHVNDAGVLGRVAIGAIASRIAGDKAQNGALTAAFEYLFNCVAHECLAQGQDAEKTFTNHLRAESDPSLRLRYNTWYDSEDNFFWGRPDIYSESLRTVWDVKPDSLYGWRSGAAQIGMYTANGVYSPGNGAPLFGSRDSITLTGSMNRYEYRFGGDGLVIYRALDPSPMERSLGRAFQNQAARTLMGPVPPRRRGY